MLQQKGFTLIEIAIVLAIIGLLVGGILKGQELINSARVRNLAQQISAVQAAYFGFMDRYRKIPGDHPGNLMSGVIGATVHLPKPDAASSNGRIDNTFSEAAGVWEQLARAGFLAGFNPASAAPGNAAAYAQHAPRNAFGGALVLTYNRAYTGVASKRLNLHMGANIPVKIASELDTKLDDGMPNTGLVRLNNADGSDTLFDGDLFAPRFSECTTTAGTTTPNNSPGSNQSSDIYDVFDNAGDCQIVVLFH